MSKSELIEERLLDAIHENYPTKLSKEEQGNFYELDDVIEFIENNEEGSIGTEFQADPTGTGLFMFSFYMIDSHSNTLATHGDICDLESTLKVQNLGNHKYNVTCRFDVQGDLGELFVMIDGKQVDLWSISINESFQYMLQLVGGSADSVKAFLLRDEHVSESYMGDEDFDLIENASSIDEILEILNEKENTAGIW